MDKQPVWKPPVPLRSEKSALRDFPIDSLPPIIREMAEAVSVTTSTDIAMASTALLSAASYCFTGVYRMTGKRDHTEPLVLNSLTVAEPSFKKSPVITHIYLITSHGENTEGFYQRRGFKTVSEIVMTNDID